MTEIGIGTCHATSGNLQLDCGSNKFVRLRKKRDSIVYISTEILTNNTQEGSCSVVFT